MTPARPAFEIGTFEERVPAAKGEGWGAGTDLHKHIDQLILARHSPPGVVVDEDLQVLQFRGHTAPYLEHTAFEPSENDSRRARPGTPPINSKGPKDRFLHHERASEAFLRQRPAAHAHRGHSNQSR